jgi:hypothetical protein
VRTITLGARITFEEVGVCTELQNPHIQAVFSSAAC